MASATDSRYLGVRSWQPVWPISGKSQHTAGAAQSAELLAAARTLPEARTAREFTVRYRFEQAHRTSGCLHVCMPSKPMKHGGGWVLNNLVPLPPVWPLSLGGEG